MDASFYASPRKRKTDVENQGRAIAPAPQPSKEILT